MAVFSCCGIILELLAKAYPDGLTIEEIMEKAKDQHTLMASKAWVNGFLGIYNGAREPDRSDIACVRVDNEKVYYNPSELKRYLNNGDRHGFAIMFNEFLKENELDNLILFEPITHQNSSHCALGLLWSELGNVRNCSWDYEEERCWGSCGIGSEKSEQILRGEKIDKP